MNASEVARVSSHIAGAEREVAARRPRRLPRLKRMARALLLRELRAYRRANVFPKNRDFRRPTPYFIDADGTRCAMAHLMELGGAATLVARIARERNNAFVSELADEPALLAWLDAAGLSVAEAARIQPTYCADEVTALCGRPGASVTAVLELTALALPSKPDGAPTMQQARVDAIHGSSGAFAIGDVTSMGDVYPEGTTLLAARAPAEATPAVPFHVEVPFLGASLGTTGSGRHATKQQLIDALLSPDCRASLVASNAYYLCNGDMSGIGHDAGSDAATDAGGTTGSAASHSSDGGCSVAPADGAVTTLQILVALVGSVVARRLARRR